MNDNAGQPTVIQALNLVMRDVTKVEKKEENTMQHFRFRGIDATTKAIAPALREHGVVVVPENVEQYDYNVEEFGKNATKMGHVLLRVRYRWYGPSGDYIDTVSVGEATDSGDKATAKAMSVAFRTCILQTLCLPTDDPDPDSDSYERSAATVAPAVVKRASSPRAVKLAWIYTGTGKNDSEIDWKLTIDGARSRDELNEAFKKAGELGVLPAVKDLLYHKADELDTSKSA